MSDGITIDTDVIRSQASNFANAGSGLSALANKLGAAILVYDGCWGNDDTGKQIAGQYLPVASDIQTSIGNMADTVNSFSDGLNTAADAYDSAEEGNSGG
jgi:PE family protein